MSEQQTMLPEDRGTFPAIAAPKVDKRSEAQKRRRAAEREAKPLMRFPRDDVAENRLLILAGCRDAADKCTDPAAGNALAYLLGDVQRLEDENDGLRYDIAQLRKGDAP